jgi:hypothetical protein
MRPRIWTRPRITAVGGTASNWLQTAAIETAFIDPGKP